MKPTKSKPSRSFFDLTPEERDRDVARFDHPIDIEKETRPLTVKERALFERSQRSPENAALLRKFDPKLLREAAIVAHKRGITLDDFIQQCVRGGLVIAEDPPAARRSRKSA
jgi:hypothetical protein